MDNFFDKKIFSKNLIYYMRKNDKKQTDLVNDLGFTKSAISSWCRGVRIPRMDKLQVLANYFGIEKSNLIEIKPECQDIFNIIENIKNILKTENNLTLEGRPISRENCQIILDALEVGIELAKSRN